MRAVEEREQVCYKIEFFFEEREQVCYKVDFFFGEREQLISGFMQKRGPMRFKQTRK